MCLAEVCLRVFYSVFLLGNHFLQIQSLPKHHPLLWLRPASLHWPCLFLNLSLPPFGGQPGHTVRLATSCFSMPFLFFLILLYFPSLLLPLYSFLSFPLLLSPPSSSPLKVFAQSGSAQRCNTLRNYHPKGSLVAIGSFSRWRRL